MLTFADIMKAVAEEYRVSRDTLRAVLPRGGGRRADGDAVEARQVASLLARRLTRRSLARIAADLGYSDHTSARCAAIAVERHLATDDALAERVARVMARLCALAVARGVPPPTGAEPTPALLASPVLPEAGQQQSPSQQATA